MDTTHVGLIYGGLSSEHEVSVRSAASVLRSLDEDRYRVTPIYIDRAGRWRVEERDTAVLQDPDALPDASDVQSNALFSPADDGAEVLKGRWNTAEGTAALSSLALDVAFPMLHGQHGEDGRVQGLFETLGLPYVGADVLGSAACMDKEVTKRLLRDHGLPIVPFHTARFGEHPPFEDVTEALGDTLFVKPANLGSSVGVSKVEGDPDAYAQALDDAFQFDTKVLIEAAVEGREIECAVIGNEEPRATVPGEILSEDVFYTYDDKYSEGENTAEMDVPADLPAGVADRLQSLAEKAYFAMNCEGFARVDFLLSPDDESDVYINEINTIPGFTDRSMFPVMWEHMGLPPGDLLDELIRLGVARYERDAALKTTH